MMVRIANCHLIQFFGFRLDLHLEQETKDLMFIGAIATSWKAPILLPHFGQFAIIISFYDLTSSSPASSSESGGTLGYVLFIDKNRSFRFLFDLFLTFSRLLSYPKAGDRRDSI